MVNCPHIEVAVEGLVRVGGGGGGRGGGGEEL